MVMAEDMNGIIPHSCIHCREIDLGAGRLNNGRISDFRRKGLERLNWLLNSSTKHNDTKVPEIELLRENLIATIQEILARNEIIQAKTATENSLAENAMDSQNDLNFLLNLTIIPYSWDDIQQYSVNGCTFFNLLLPSKTFEFVIKYGTQKAQFGFLPTLYLMEGHVYCVEVEVERRLSGYRVAHNVSKSRIVFKATRSYSSSEVDFECPAVFPNVYPGSRKSLELYASWCKECATTEDKPPHSYIKAQPSYLIELLTVKGIHSPRLVKIENSLETKSYAALSYCWGPQSKNFITSIATLDQHLACLKHEELPATIQDAILVTEGLGLRYLWVDAICIVQDDKNFVNSEIRKMCDIYKGAFITIAASCASSVHQGFLKTRFEEWVNGEKAIIEVSHTSVDGYKQPVYLFQSKCQVPDVEPLEQRAWALQEHFLSPRILDFRTQTTKWHCLHENHDREDGWHYSSVRRSTLPFRQITLGYKPWGTGQAFDYWHDVVNQYLLRQLTRNEDRLIAIGGIATQWSNYLPNDDYLAGLWKQDLPTELMWEPDPVPKHKRPEKYQGPSWSWAGTNSQAVLNPYTDIPSLEDMHKHGLILLDHHIELVSGQGKFGAVTSASLTVKVHITEVTYQPGLNHQLGHFKTPKYPEQKLSISTMWDTMEPEWACQGQNSTYIYLMVVAPYSGYDGPCGLILKSLPNERFMRIGRFGTLKDDDFVKVGLLFENEPQTIILV